MSDNGNLHAAKREKNDEFYTSIDDVAAEMAYYEGQFQGRTVLCNCDDPEWSAFWRYFSDNFRRLGLKRLISTHYEEGRSSYRLDINAPCQQTLPIDMRGDGDFRSAECLALLDEADIVCTNPPFSLFREYISTLMEHGKRFIVLGALNAVSYKEVFPYIRDGRMWLGPSQCNGTKDYRTPDGSVKKLGNTIWFTNMDHSQRHEPAVLTKRLIDGEYPIYDNYDAINVDRAADIPSDYEGVMGVPISFLDKLCPEQFELVGMTASWDETPAMAAIKTSAEHRHGPFIDGRELYKRVLIRRCGGDCSPEDREAEA